MKAIKSLFAVWLLGLTVWATSAAYEEIQCNTDPVFAANSCSQCFDGWAKGEGANLWFLSDDWVNGSGTAKILYKEEQEMPKMVNLDASSVSWKSVPGEAGFWEYTDAFNELYKPEEEGYVLAKSGKVTWLASKTAYAYNLEKNTAAEGKNIWLIVYPLTTHNISETGDISVDAETHRECVLIKSWAVVEKEVLNTWTTPKPTTPWKTTPAAPAKELPKTWPEHYVLLMILAMVLGFGIMRVRKAS